MEPAFSFSLALLGALALAIGCAPVPPDRARNADCAAPREDCLRAAVRDGDVPRFGRLLDAGAFLGGADAEGNTVVHLAAISNNPAFLDALLRHGADPDTPNAVTAWTPLMSAIVFERDAQIEHLLEAGVDLARTDRTGNTALHVAAQINDPGKVLLLLKAGAPVEVLNAQGQTFQRYLYAIRPGLLHRRAAEDLARVTAWLQRRGLLERQPADAHQAGRGS